MLNTNSNFSACNPKIEVVDVVGRLIGNEALGIQDYLYRCLDEGRCYQIIDLKQTNQIDGLGMALFENFISRGLEIRIINAKPEVKAVISMAKKESLFRIIYDEKDRAKAASLFERDILEKEVISGDGVLKKRRHTRVNTFSPSEFKLRTNHGTTSGRANILNLSEGGVLAGRIIIMNANIDEIVNCQVMSEQETCDLKFKLNGDSTSISARGKCVRTFMIRESLYAGIRFEDLSYQQREIICSFVVAHK